MGLLLNLIECLDSYFYMLDRCVLFTIVSCMIDIDFLADLTCGSLLKKVIEIRHVPV